MILFQGTEDLAAFLNPDQPLIMSAVVSQSSIDQQEAIVKETRLKLAQAIEALSGWKPNSSFFLIDCVKPKTSVVLIKNSYGYY